MSTSIAMPSFAQTSRSAATLSPWPWVSGLILLACFAAANWAWSDVTNWSITSDAEVENLVDRISEGNARRQVAMAALGVFGLIMLVTPTSREIRVRPVLLYATLVFVGWAFISVSWSVDRGQTAKRLVVFAGMCMSAAGLVKHYDIRQLARVAFIIAVGTLLASMFMEALSVAKTGFPGMGKYRFGGMLHPNHAGINTAIALLASFYLYKIEPNRRARLIYLAVMFVAAGVLYWTKSRTALMGAATGMAAFWLLATHTRRVAWALLIVTWGAAAVLWLTSMDMMPSLKSMANMGRDDLKKTDVTKLTGRTDIWKFALMQADRDPNRVFTGYGYETFWTPHNVAGVSSFVKFRISEGHNVYLDWFLELGVVGAGLYCALVLASLLRWAMAARRLASPSAAIVAATLAAALIHGFAESSCGDANPAALFVFAAIAAATLCRPDELETA